MAGPMEKQSHRPGNKMLASRCHADLASAKVGPLPFRAAESAMGDAAGLTFDCRFLWRPARRRFPHTQPGNAFQTTRRLMSNTRGRLNVTFMVAVGTGLSPV
jgi:hypothetical protein